MNELQTRQKLQEIKLALELMREQLDDFTIEDLEVFGAQLDIINSTLQEILA